MNSTIDGNVMPDGYVSWDDLKNQVAAARTPEQRREYEDSALEAEMQIALRELIYDMRMGAGLTQTELADRMGVRQPFISDLERGGRTPTVLTINRIAHATGNQLRLVVEPLDMAA